MNEYSFIIKAVFPLSSPNPKKAEKPQAAPERPTFIRKQGIFQSMQGLAVPDRSRFRPRPHKMSDYSFLIDFPASGS
jgi:hypothetical protein